MMVHFFYISFISFLGRHVPPGYSEHERREGGYTCPPSRRVSLSDFGMATWPGKSRGCWCWRGVPFVPNTGFSTQVLSNTFSPKKEIKSVFGWTLLGIKESVFHPQTHLIRIGLTSVCSLAHCWVIGVLGIGKLDYVLQREQQNFLQQTLPFLQSLLMLNYLPRLGTTWLTLPFGIISMKDVGMVYSRISMRGERSWQSPSSLQTAFTV